MSSSIPVHPHSHISTFPPQRSLTLVSIVLVLLLIYDYFLARRLFGTHAPQLQSSNHAGSTARASRTPAVKKRLHRKMERGAPRVRKVRRALKAATAVAEAQVLPRHLHHLLHRRPLQPITAPATTTTPPVPPHPHLQARRKLQYRSSPSQSTIHRSSPCLSPDDHSSLVSTRPS